MRKKILVGSLMLLVVAAICFGVVFAILYFSGDSNDEVFVSAYQDDVVGVWNALKCEPVGDGTAFDAKGKSFEFTDDFIMIYYEDAIEITDKRANYSWKSESEMLLYMPSNQTERSLILSFNSSGNLIAEDTGMKVIWTLEKSGNSDLMIEAPYISPFHEKVLDTWSAIDCSRNGETFPFDGKSFIFNADMTLQYYEDGVEIADKACIFSWTDETVMKLKADSGEEREWLLSVDPEGNLIVQDDTYGLIWTLKRGK